MTGTFFDCPDMLYHHAKLEEDHTKRAGCRCENVVFVFCLFVTFRVGPAVLEWDICLL